MPFLEKKAHPERNVNKDRKKCLERSANGKGQEKEDRCPRTAEAARSKPRRRPPSGDIRARSTLHQENVLSGFTGFGGKIAHGFALN